MFCVDTGGEVAVDESVAKTDAKRCKRNIGVSMRFMPICQKKVKVAVAVFQCLPRSIESKRCL